MKRLIAALAVSTALVATPGVHAQEAEIFTPDSTWAVDYGEDYCRLLRDFTNGSDTVSLLLERAHPINTMRVVVVGNAVRTFRGADMIGLRFLPSGAPRMAMKLATELPDGQQMLNLGPQLVGEFEMPEPGAPPEPPAIYSREEEREKAAAISGLRLEQGLTRPVELQTGSMAEPIQALQDCADDMLTYWELDAEAHQSLSRVVLPGDGAFVDDSGAPVNPSAGWISQNTVGFDDFARLGGGNNEIRVMVNAAGEPTDCAVHFPSLGESTNARICEQVMENGEFLPALDVDGQPIDSYWMTSVFALTPPFGG